MSDFEKQINASDLIEWIIETDPDWCVGSVRSIIDHIDKMSSAQPEIIRCRDCKHWDKTWTNNWSPNYHYCPKIDEVRRGDFHCRYAERRTDETD